MPILNGCKRILTYSGLDSIEFSQFNQKCICQLTIRLIVYSVLIICILSVCTFYSDKAADGLDTILMPLAILITWISLLLTYTSLMLNTDKIADLMEYLENVIEKRKENNNNKTNINRSLFLKTFFGFLFKGSRQYIHSRTLYERRNRTTETAIRMLFKYTITMASVVYLIPAMFPLLYVYLGYPTPDFWFTPLGLDEA